MRGVIQQTLCQQMTHFSRPTVNSTAALVLRSLSDEPETRAQTVILYVFIRSPMTSSLSRHPAFLSLQGGINFRDPGEVARTPDKLSPLTHYLNAPANPPVSEVNAKVTELNAATLNALNGEQFMLQLYRQLPFNNPAYRQLAAWLTTPFEGALLQHCAVGKDRTGVGCALTLFAVGCDSETVMEEYLLTHGMLTQVEAWMLELLGNDLTAQGRQSLADILTVKESYLAAALSAIHQRYGTVDAWLAAEYQLTAPVRAALQARLLEE
ncbi:tyrosine-protein phosphatase [Klebsiella pneumoniae]